MKTREEVERLKADWASDPCWDLETTEGFEEYHDELLAFVDAKEAEWEANRNRVLTQQAEELGVPGQLSVAHRWEMSVNRRRACIERATDLLDYYMGLAGVDVQFSDRKIEMRDIVESIVSAAEAGIAATMGVELAKLRK